MANRKDVRREDLIVPYREPETEKESDMASTMGSTLPMAAIFTRNKLIGWTSVMFAVQSWLAETPAQRATAAAPAFWNVLMSILAAAVAYLPLFMAPPPAAQGGPGVATGAGAPAAVPQ